VSFSDENSRHELPIAILKVPDDGRYHHARPSCETPLDLGVRNLELDQDQIPKGVDFGFSAQYSSVDAPTLVRQDGRAPVSDGIDQVAVRRGSNQIKYSSHLKALQCRFRKKSSPATRGWSTIKIREPIPELINRN
jgi:hypothetical protein